MKVPCSITVLLGCWDSRRVIRHSSLFVSWSAILMRIHCFFSMSTGSVFIFLTVAFYVGQQYVGNTVLSYDNGGNANAPHCYVIGSLLILLQDIIQISWWIFADTSLKVLVQYILYWVGTAYLAKSGFTFVFSAKNTAQEWSIHVNI
jgi:hypothetical protein